MYETNQTQGYRHSERSSKVWIQFWRKIHENPLFFGLSPFRNSKCSAKTILYFCNSLNINGPVLLSKVGQIGDRHDISVEPLLLADYEKAIGEAQRRGVMGGGIYDSLHASFARRKGAKRIVTRNPSHFAHVAPDLEILMP